MSVLLFGCLLSELNYTLLASAPTMAVGAVLIAVFAKRQSKLEVPMLRVETLRTRRFRNAVILCGLMEAALLSIDVLLPLLLEDSLGASLTALALGIEDYRLGFIGCAVLLAAVAVMVVVGVRDR